MKNRTTINATGPRHGRRGAALILAIAIMTILLAIALTFYAISRQEVDNADNVKNRVQADLLTDAAMAMTIARINEDFAKYPEVTSLDHPLFTYFNGSWIVGKDWGLWKPDGVNALPLQEGGIPLVNMADMPYMEYVDGAGNLQREHLYSGPLSRDWLYYPRVERGANFMYSAAATGTFYQGPTGAALFTSYLNGQAFIPEVFNINNRWGSGNPVAPFVTPAFYGTGFGDVGSPADGVYGMEREGYAIELIDTWTDVDSDGDGKRDAIWIPIGRELFSGGGEALMDGTDARLYDDGIDGDLDGMIDENQEDGVDDDLDGEIDDNDEQMEISSFIYNGASDGRDNDGDGSVDEADENKLFLTTPLPELVIPVDFNADGQVPDYVPNAAGELEILRIALPPTITVNTDSGPVTLSAADVDVLDNDYDMLANDYHVYAYIGPNPVGLAPFRLSGFEDTGERYPPFPAPPAPFGAGSPIIRAIEDFSRTNSYVTAFTATHYDSWQLVNNWVDTLNGVDDRPLYQTAIRKSYQDINLDATLPSPLAISPATGAYWSDALNTNDTIDYTVFLPYIRVTHSGEPVSELVGRAAIHVRDTSSQINLNTAGAHTLDPIDGEIRALGDGTSTGEIETRILPLIGWELAGRMWTQRTGSPDGNPASWDASAVTDFAADIAYPGLGRVDDNGNLLATALNGKDDDGDGLIDEGLYLPDGSDPFLYARYYDQLGAFEGVDEFAELQRYRPLPNLLAEDNNPYNLTGYVDGIDNDLDDALNERGEFGDIQLNDTLRVKAVYQIGDVIYDYMHPSVTAFSTDRNANFVTGADGVRAVNKLDYNYASAQEIAANLLLVNSFELSTADNGLLSSAGMADAPRRYAAGLLQGDVHWRASNDLLMGGSIDSLPAENILQAMQTAVDIVDNRDRKHSRSVLTTERQDIYVPDVATAAAVFDTFPLGLGLRERIADTELFPLEEIEAYLRDAMGVHRKLQIEDDWWTFTVGAAGVNGNPEQRNISYTVSGNEAIRINELMVRPVRRIEAEAITAALPLNADDPMDAVIDSRKRGFDPTPFDNHLTGPNILPQFDVTRRALLNNWDVVENGTLGDGSYLRVTADPLNIPASIEILEFTIRTSEGLPPGRYYLTVDTRVDGVGTVTAQGVNPPVLEAAVKYVDLDPAAIAPQNLPIVLDPLPYFYPVPDEQISDQIPGAPGGWVFIDGTQGDNVAEDTALYHLDGLPAEPLAFPNPLPERRPGPGVETFTVYVPEEGSRYELHIGLRLNQAYVASLGAPLTFAINALDFSQEPDHEWVELINVSDETVDVGSWELEVGIPHRNGAPVDPFKSVWTIPEDTEIAAGGMILLAFNKFDFFQDVTSPYRSNAIYANGMGLADGDFVNAGSEGLVSGALTVPTAFDDYSGLSAYPRMRDLTGSVFRRLIDPQKGFVDYVDRDGDGLSSFFLDANGDGTIDFPDTDQVAVENLVTSSKEYASAFSGDGTQPWDRIIQLNPSSRVGTLNPYTSNPTDIDLNSIDTLEQVASMVLKGGVFPNYPEHDGIDNDGDGGYISTGGFYIPGTLDMDMVDNNLDGVIDERGFDPVSPADYSSVRSSEGVDEGNILFNTDVAGTGDPWVPGGTFWRAYGPGSYEPVALPQVFAIDRANYDALANIIPVDGGAGEGVDALAPGLTYRAIADAASALNNNSYLADAPYIGSVDDPADWRAFSERRWNPGDNVIVTLYEDDSASGKVVDRVTYREYDVINRTVDDLAPFLIDTTDDGNFDTAVSIHPNYPTFWLPNHMGLDFYRSLERKHPLYNGDRFGTENRWQATDGNYDDWSDSLSFFESRLSTVAGNPVTVSDYILSDVGLERLSTAPGRQLYGHAMAGSPLRMNAATRRSENPPDIERTTNFGVATNQFPDAYGLYRSHEDNLTSAATQYDQGWNHDQAVVRNRPYQSPGDLMRLSHQVYVHDALNTSVVDPIVAIAAGQPGYLRDMTLLNVNLETGVNPEDITAQDIALRGATLGQDDFGQAITGSNLLREAINSMAIDPMILTVGQSEFHPIRPELTPGDAQNANLLNWVPAGGDADLFFAPATWAPVFLFELPTDDGVSFPRSSLDHLPNYPTYDTGVNLSEFVPRHYLFNGNYLSTNMGGYYNNVYDNRWTLEQRTALYVSQNRAGLQQPEALWIWDGADGLENGEYIVYIGTFMSGMSERVAKAAEASAGLFPPQLDATVAASLIPKVITEFAAANSGDLTTYTTGDNNGVVMDRVTASLLRRDPTYDRSAYGGDQQFDPVYAIDIITEPTEARGRAPQAATTATPQQKPAGLIHPDDWVPTNKFRADDDGYIFYGNNTAGGWRPQIVRVTDNFLALRVRNLGSLSEIGAISHIVLAPRKRTAGRINVNTAAARMVPEAGNTNQEYVSALLGLPGVVDVARTVVPTVDGANFVAGPIAPNDAVAIMDINNLEGNFPTNDPNQFDNGWGQPAYLYDTAPLATPPGRNIHLDVITPDSDLLVPSTLDTFPLPDDQEHRVGAFRMNALLIGGRTEHASGRFYESVGDLVLDSSAYDFNYFLGRADTPDFTTWTLGVEDSAVYPLSNEELPAKRFEETIARFSRMGNLITTRSDVYEIIMTVEAGYGVDRNNDGTINYRDPDEFVTTAATKATAVYERRTPTDQSDGGE